MKKTQLVIPLFVLTTLFGQATYVFPQGGGGKAKAVESTINALKKGGSKVDNVSSLKRISNTSTSSTGKYSGSNSSGYSGGHSGTPNYSGGTLSSTNVRYNAGYRTPDGKFASPTGKAPAPGVEAEKSVWNHIENKPGWSVTRGRVHVKDGNNNVRVYDGVAHSPRGRSIGLEIKSGSATKTSSQRTFDSNLNNTKTNTVQGTGRNQGLTLRRSTEIRSN